MSATTPPSTPAATPNPLQDFFNGLLAVIKTQFLSLSNQELVAAAPALTNFLTYFEQNPAAASNPVLWGPQLLLLQTSILAVQGNLVNTNVAQFATSLNGLVTKIAAEAKAQLPAA